jgi:crotonobetainyl-CoA:carnitine CoA-transferase CaiB-like acyl-CoA transferase
MQTDLPLKNLKVVELAGVLAGPAVGMFLAELGATVIKIENPPHGDVTRSWKSASENPENPVSAYYASVNWGKTSQFTDLKSAEGYTAVLHLLDEADVVITNFKAGDAEKLRLTPALLHARNPKLVYASISGFGDDDPRVAFDLVLQAEAGFMSMNGTAESGPLKMPVALIDVLAAHQLKEGILLALLQRASSGTGATVSVSLYDAALAALANQAGNYLMNNSIPQRTGSLHPNIAPYGETFSCADGEQVVIAAGSDRQFETLCSILGLDALAADADFSTNAQRVKNRGKLAEKMAPAFTAGTAERWLNTLSAAGVPAGRIRNLERVFSQDSARRLVLTDANGQRVKTAVFRIVPVVSEG